MRRASPASRANRVRHRARGAVAARGLRAGTSTAARSRASGTRPSSTRFGATCRRRPRMPGISSTSRPRCGTRGLPTTARADGYFSREKHRAADVQAARETAISYAAYRILLWRYAQGAGLQTTFDALTATMTSLCLSPAFTSTQGSAPAALGNRIAAAVIEGGARATARSSGSDYADASYRAVNEPLVVAQPGATMHDPVFWQPLALDQIIAQNGIAVPGRVQSFIGAGWGHVRGFALPASAKGLSPIDPGKPPFGDGRLGLLQAAGGRGDSGERRARRERRDDDRHRPGRARRQSARHERRQRLRASTRSPASRTPRTSSGAPTSRAS